MPHASPLLTLALLAPTVLVAPALTQQSPAEEQSRTAAQYDADYLASPKAWRDADLHHTQFIIDQLKLLAPIGEDDSNARYLKILKQDAEIFYLASKSMLSFDVPTLYQDRIQEIIKLQESYLESFKNSPLLTE